MPLPCANVIRHVTAVGMGDHEAARGHGLVQHVAERLRPNGPQQHDVDFVGAERMDHRLAIVAGNAHLNETFGKLPGVAAEMIQLVAVRNLCPVHEAAPRLPALLGKRMAGKRQFGAVIGLEDFLTASLAGPLSLDRPHVRNHESGRGRPGKLATPKVQCELGGRRDDERVRLEKPSELW